MRIAITRAVSPGIGKCQLTHVERAGIDVAVASAQHREYERCLSALGCKVRTLPADPDLPDSVFVEDAAVVLDEVAVIARPGAESRRAETGTVAGALRPHRALAAIGGPGTLDGGDVLVVGRTVYVGLSGRTNANGFEQFRGIVEPLGYAVSPVPVTGCLHLKSAVTRVAPDRLLINRRWIDPENFRGLSLLDVDPAEPFAANALLVGETVVFPAAFPRTRGAMERTGIRVTAVDVSEIAKAEGGVTCCSLIFEEA
jgi:dimethylargininase